MCNSCVCPILDYCAELWGFKDFKQIYYVQNRAIRIFLCVYRFAQFNAINGDMEWSASDLRRKVAMCRLWNKIITMENNRLHKLILNWDINLKYINTWSNIMKDVLYTLNMNANFDNRNHVSITSVWSLLHEIICKYWEENIIKMPKLRIYITFKKHIEVEPYILSFMNHNRRSYLAQFQNGILPL